jgi:sarcosine dehydrogenase
MGPDPFLKGLFHNVGFNSAGMMLGAGCAKQLAHWIVHDRPELHMYAYDIRRFSAKQRKASDWAIERSHESYAKNYSIVFPNDQNQPFLSCNSLIVGITQNLSSKLKSVSNYPV